MSFPALLGGRRALRVAVTGILLAIACSAPDYNFVPGEPEHCQNNKPDPDAGETDADCGGPSCRGCSYGQHCNVSTDCAEGQCIAGFCQEPGCENQAVDGDETGTDCGGGTCPACRDGQPCEVALDCESGVCGPDGSCASPTCMDEVRNGDELDVDCGGSSCDGCGIGSPCALAVNCESGLCDETTKTCALNCARGTDECDNDVSEPCETNLLASARNCGACGVECELPHANVSCVGGACQIDACVEPWIRCNTDEDDGCEVNASNDAENCGGCGMVCPALHGEPSCVSSACAIDCEDGFGDCDENPLTGCEASIGDVENCGECKKKCPASGGVPFCLDGECGATVCDEGKGDCDGDGDCETSLDGDAMNCGRCGNICGAANGQVECVAGACVISQCDSGWENCDDEAPDGGFADGCEINVASDTRNCGGCGERCDMVANGMGSCQGGNCDLLCNAGFKDCDTRVDTGCETNTTSDPDHCGGCANACDIPHAIAGCSNSNCVIDDCAGSYMDCTAADGCETDTSNSIQHCGNCVDICSKAGATDASCSDGECDPPQCDTAHRSCDGDNANGCETDVTTPTACGACNKVCGSATPNCVLSGSTYSCQAKITISNGLPYPSTQVVGNTLTFNATPHAGTNRLILMVVASDSPGNGINGARPDSVTFGGQAMTAGPSFAGHSDTYSPDLFVYYLPLGDSATEGSQIGVSINAATSPAANVIMMQEFQLNGVRQSNPITGSMGQVVGSPDPSDPATTSVTLPVTISGSMIYSIMSPLWAPGDTCTAGTPSGNCPAWSVTPSSGLTVTETLSIPQQSYGGPAPIRAFGMVVSATSASLPAAGSYAPTWTLPNDTRRLTHLALAIAPAQGP